MRKTYILPLICCILMLAAGTIAGCTGTETVATPATPTTPGDASPTAVSTVMQTPVPASPASSPADIIAKSVPETLLHAVFVNSTANGKIVTVPVGEKILVRLPENPTTGYSWNATASKGLAIISDTYTAPDTTLIGAGGYHDWILSPATVDTYTFRAVSFRPWEGPQGTDEKFSLVILVTRD